MGKKLILMIAFVIIVSFTTTAFAIPMENFFSYGISAGDSWLYPNDDGSAGELSFSFEYYGTNYTSLWVNNNGNVTFDDSMYTYTPFAFPGSRVIIAPYFADVDTRDGDVEGDHLNDVYYGTRSSVSDLTVISDIVNNAYGETFDATNAFITTWDHVGYYAHHNDSGTTNTFQLALATDGFDSYVIFNYLDSGMYWESGDASGGSGGFGGTEAVAGFDKGDSINYYMVPGSRDSGIAEILEDGSNIGVPGQYVFQVNQTIIPPPPSPVPEPCTILLLGFGLLGMLGFNKRRLLN